MHRPVTSLSFLRAVSLCFCTYLLSACACVCVCVKRDRNTLSRPRMPLKLSRSVIHISTRQEFSFLKRYHKSCHAYRVSLFSVIAFTATGRTSSYCSVQDVACHHHHEQSTDQNKQANFLLHRHYLCVRLTTDVQGLPHPSGKTQALRLFASLLYLLESVRYF